MALHGTNEELPQRAPFPGAKVLFLCHSLGIGGVEKALLAEINQWLKLDCKITIGLLEKKGELLEGIPDKVEIIELQEARSLKEVLSIPPLQRIKNLYRNRRLKALCIEGLLLALGRAFNKRRFYYNYMFRSLRPLNTRFDVGIAFAGPDAFMDNYLWRKVQAAAKWGWIHFDVTHFGVDSDTVRNIYPKFERINVMSCEAKQKFDKKFPFLSNLTKFTPEIIDKDCIVKLSRTEVVQLLGSPAVLTIGRISDEKGQLLALQALPEILKTFPDLGWTFVGNGTGMDACKNLAHELGIEAHVYLTGALLNPYPYLKECHLYVQPSKHEGFCLTLAEALLFKMPIVCTDFTGAREQLQNRYDSHISEYDPHKLAEAVIAALNSGTSMNITKNK